ncbi:MAG: DUF4405 domain-containing protein [Caldilineaceae bacterium]
MQTQVQTQKPSRTTINYLVDSTIFLAFLVAMNPHMTGMAVHEWLGLSFGAGILTHLLLHWQWIVGVTTRLFGKVAKEARINYIVNLLFFIDMVIVIFTGVMISESALPTLGITLAHSFLWRGVHTTAANGALVLLGVHVALHWRWIVSTTKRYFARLHGPHRAANPTVTLPRGVVQKGA